MPKSTKRRTTDPPAPASLVPAAVERMRGSASRVWGALARRGADVAPVAISQSAIARDLEVSRPTVRRALLKLEAAGLARQDGREGRRAYWQVFWEDVRVRT